MDSLRIEAADQVSVVILELRIVETGLIAGEGNDFPVVIGRLTVVSSGLEDHAEAVVAIMQFRPTLDHHFGGVLGIVQFSGVDESNHCVGRGINLFVTVFAEARVMVRQMVCRLGGGDHRASAGPVLGETALLVFLATAAGTGLIASDFGHFPGLRQKGWTPLYQALLANAKFHEQLLAFDRDLAAQARAAGCPDCAGVLHSANYRRKPRGRPMALGEEHDRRFSFCCAVDGCRDRTTPASVRFLGRKVYLATVVTLVSAMSQGPTERRLGTLAKALGIDRRTVARWREWWLSTFTASPFWTTASAAFMPPADLSCLPASLLDRFAGGAEERLLALLRFLGPITGGSSVMRAF